MQWQLDSESPDNIGSIRMWLSRLFPVRYLAVTVYMAYTDLKKEATSTFAGVIWWILEPVLSMAVFYFLIVVIFKRSTENFVAFLLVGLVVWRWLNVSVVLAASSIRSSYSLMKQVYLPKVVFPVKALLVDSAKFSIAFLCLCLFLAVTGMPVLRAIGYLPLLLVTQFVLILGFALICSAIVPFLPDFLQILSFGLRGLFFLSGVLFDVSQIPGGVTELLYFNPMVSLINGYRNVLLEGQAPDVGPIVLIFISMCILCITGLMLHARLDYVFPKLAR